MATTPKLTIGALTFDVPTLDAGVLEDHEEDVRAYLALKPEIPVGKDMGAIISLVTVLAQRAQPSAGVTREMVRAGITVRNLREVMKAIAWAFGFDVKEAKDDAGEAGSPSSST